MSKCAWEIIEETGGTTERLKVEGGYLYHVTLKVGSSMCFVPDVDLQRYQSHLRDAYNRGFKDGQGEAKIEPNSSAYNRGYQDGLKDSR